MRLSELLNGITVIKYNASFDENIEYIANDHRRVTLKSIFVAIKGTKRNGNDYIEEAIQNGATVIITDEIYKCKMSLPYVLVKDAREALAKLWSNFYKNPAKSLKTVAITGTNGKTSTAFILYSILKASKIPCGLISTIGTYINEKKIEIDGGGSVSDVSSAMTTPDPEYLYFLYNKMKENGVKIVVIEASSHALYQKRLSAIDVDIAVFTNLTREHLDFHRNMDEYFSAKKLLFEKCKTGIVNIDNRYGKEIKNNFKNIYGCSKKEKSEFYAENIQNYSNCSEFQFLGSGINLKIKTNLVGEFNVSNTILATACAVILGIEDKAIETGVSQIERINGRLERYGNRNIYIDYAHTPAAMEKVISTIKEIHHEKRVIVLFGCGGDRDKGKRAEMGEICSKLADYTVITSDNSRTEDPKDIIKDILSGIDKNKHFAIIEDRKKAIKQIVSEMDDNDVLLLLGKGHEEYEITREGKTRFSEKDILDEVLNLDK